MMYFLAGLFLGATLGVITLALVSMGKTSEEMEVADDSDRLDFLDLGHSLTYRNGMYAVLSSNPVKIIGMMETCPRKAIDSARFRMEDEASGR